MVKNEKKKISLESLDERLERVEISQRKAGVQLDRLEYKFDLCLEGFGSLKERADKIEDRVGILDSKI